MTNAFRYSFEELPLLIKAGFEAGLVTGHAEIAYRRDGSWSVEEIYLGGYRLRSPAERATMRSNGLKPTVYERKPVQVGLGESLFNLIRHRLEHEWAERVQDAVNDRRSGDHASACDDAADCRRDELRGVA